MNIRQAHSVFVGEVSDIDITQPLTRDQVAAIEAGMDRHAVGAAGFRDPTDIRFHQVQIDQQGWCIDSGLRLADQRTRHGALLSWRQAIL